MGAYANNETFVKWQSSGDKKVYTLDGCKAPKRPRSHDYGGRGYGGRGYGGHGYGGHGRGAYGRGGHSHDGHSRDGHSHDNGRY